MAPIVTEQELSLPRLRMHVLACGPERGTPVVLLHGFPEMAESWRDVMPYLAEAGFRAVAPDLRGYGQTDKPDGGYDIDSLAQDVADLIHALGGKAHVVGHDWGGAIAYHVAAMHPEQTLSLSVVNCPPAHVMSQRMWRLPQLKKSWYMLAFQLPFLPEWALSRDGGSLVARMLRAAAVDKTNFSRERLSKYAANFADRRVARAGVSYYRQAARALLTREGRRKMREYPRIQAPFRLIWGEEDVALGKELTYGLDPYFEKPVDIRYLPGVGHFAPIEAPQKVGPLIVEHVQKSAA